MEVYVLIVAVSFLTNVIPGYFRRNTKKFSFMWFFLIHVSIPFIVYLRVTLQASSWCIPFTIATAVAGQIIGSRGGIWLNMKSFSRSTV